MPVRMPMLACEGRAAAAAPAVAEAAKPALAALLALTLTIGTVLASLVDVRAAYAETTNIDAELTDEQRRVEETAAAYNEAVERVEDLDAQIEENEDRIAEINRDLPERREAAADAVREMYEMQRRGIGIVELMLGSESLSDFLMRFEYVNRIQESNASAVESLEALGEELERTSEALSAARIAAEEERVAAEAALAKAQEARRQAQQEALERAEADREEIEDMEGSENGSSSGDEGIDADAGEGSDDGAAGDAGESAEGGSSAETPTPPENDDADWTSDKATFVAQWGARIDAFLAGSPLAGQGETFASAAWDYGVDPRFSPAIAAVESTKGAYCFYPYNAWGWGSVSWSSWEEAIRGHVSGLARGYGYTVTIEGAQKYCPPNWQHWYNSVSSYMNMI